MKIRRYFILANLILTALICWTAYSVYATWSSDRKRGSLTSKAGTPQVAKETHAGRSTGLAHYQSIISQDIFGTTILQKQSAERVEKPRIEEVPVSHRSLYLKGTVFGRDTKFYAVIADGKGMEGDVFRVNDLLQNARVLQILPDRVILVSEGKQEALILTYDLNAEEKTAPKAEVQKPLRGRADRTRVSGRSQVSRF